MNLVLKLQIAFIVPEKAYLDICAEYISFGVGMEQQHGGTCQMPGIVNQAQVLQQMPGRVVQHPFIHTSASCRFLAETVQRTF